MPQGQGPFSQYLTETFQPKTPQPTGFETTPVAIAAIGSKFLDGLRQSRLQKAAMAERENEKIQRAHEQAIEFAQKQQGVDPSVIQRNVNRLTQSYLAHIAGQKESSKDTGHPMTDMVKNIAMNLIGGQLPKKGAPLDPGLIGQVFTELNDPANRTDNLLARLNSDFATALKTGNVADIRTATAHPEYSKIVAEGRRLTGRQDWQPDIFQSLAADPFTAQREKLQAAALNNPRVLAMVGGTAPPPAQATPAAQAAPGQAAPVPGFIGLSQDESGAVVTPGQTQPIPTSGVAPKQQTLFSYIADKTREQAERAYASKLTGLPMPPDEPMPKIGDPVDVMDSTKQIRKSRYLPSDIGPFKAGEYDATTGEYLTGTRKVSPLNPESVKKVLTPEEQSKLKTDLFTQIDAVIPDPKLAKMAKASVESQVTSGDAKGAGDELRNFVQIYQSQENSRASRQMAQAIASQGAGLRRDMAGFQVAQQFGTQEPVKKMRVIDEYTNNVNSAYSALKSGGDPGIYDLEIMRAWAKITDPLTGVREGEYRDIAGIQGNIRDFNVKINNLLKTEGARLDDKSREAIVSAINRIHKNQYETQFKPLYESFRSDMDKAKLGANGIVSDPYAARIAPKDKKKESNNPAPAKVSALDPRAPRRRAGKSEEPPVTPGKSATVNKPKITVKPI